MPYLRCTVRLLKQMDPEAAREARSDTSDESPEDWYANLVWIEGRKCVLFTHVGTLFPFIVLDVRRPQIRTLSQTFRSEYERNLMHAGATPHQIAQELFRQEHLRIGKSQNKRVLGSMTDYGLMAKSDVEWFGGLRSVESLTISARLADTLMSAIGYSSGICELRTRLASYGA